MMFLLFTNTMLIYLFFSITILRIILTTLLFALIKISKQLSLAYLYCLVKIKQNMEYK